MFFLYNYKINKMPELIKMKLFNSNYNYIIPNNNVNNNATNYNVLMKSNTKRKCALLFLQGNKRCSSCSGK